MTTHSAPKVTVGVPFFNEAPYLEAAVRSILAQTLVDIEVLLVDDGSTDRSLEIARSFDDPRVVVSSDGVRRRLPARLNEIAARARAGFVARMDADDVAHPTRLERQLRMLTERPEYAAVGTWIGLVDGDGAPFAVIEASGLPVSRAQALDRGIFPHATMFARRDWLRANPYDEQLDRAEDRDLWCRTVANNEFGVIPEVLYVVRVSSRRPDFLPDYLASQRQNRMLFVRYGPMTYGYLRTATAWLASHGKDLVVRGAVWLRASERLVRRRGRSPTADEVARIREALAAAEL